MILEGRSYTVGMRVFLFVLILRLLPGVGIFILLAFTWLTIPQLAPLVDSLNVGTTSIVSLQELFTWVSVLAVLLFVLYAALVLVFTWLEYITYTYQINTNGLLISSGILHRQEKSIPFRQIQNMEIKRSLFFRFFGMSKLVILTAAHEDSSTPEAEAEIVIRILTKQTCEQLREQLLHLAHTQRVAQI